MRRYRGGVDENGDLVLVDAYTFTVGTPPADELWGGTSDVWDVAGSRDDDSGVLSVEFKRYLDTGDATDVPIDGDEMFPCVWAFSSGTDTMDLTRYHRYSRGFLRTQFFSSNLCTFGECVRAKRVLGERASIANVIPARRY